MSPCIEEAPPPGGILNFNYSRQISFIYFIYNIFTLITFFKQMMINDDDQPENPAPAAV